MNRILSKLIISLCILVVFLNIAVKADSMAAPYSYKKEIGNGKYVFVMLADDSKKILSKTATEYSKSGLYENDGSVTPLWTIDWYQYEGMVFFTDDGQYISSLGPWANLSSNNRIDLNQLAVSFYNKGNLVKEYYISDLVKNTLYLEKSASHFEWRENVDFDENAATFTILTKDNNEYVFDVRTVNIIKKNIKSISIKALISILGIAALGLFFIIKRFRRKKTNVN